MSRTFWKLWPFFDLHLQLGENGSFEDFGYPERLSQEGSSYSIAGMILSPDSGASCK